MTQNVTQGEGVNKAWKKCHELFEWTLKETSNVFKD